MEYVAACIMHLRKERAACMYVRLHEEIGRNFTKIYHRGPI